MRTIQLVIFYPKFHARRNTSRPSGRCSFHGALMWDHTFFQVDCYLFFLFLHPVRLHFSILATGRLVIFLSFFCLLVILILIIISSFFSWPWCSSKDHGTFWCNTSAAGFDHRSGATNKEPVIKDYDDDVDVLVVILMVMMMNCGCCGCWLQNPTLFLGL